jgi:hypothetical protein
MPRELGQFPPAVFQHLLRLPRDLIWEILEALQGVCDDPNLLDLEEEEGQQFIIAAGYAVFVDVDDEKVTVVALRKIGAN